MLAQDPRRPAQSYKKRANVQQSFPAHLLSHQCFWLWDLENSTICVWWSQSLRLRSRVTQRTTRNLEGKNIEQTEHTALIKRKSGLKNAGLFRHLTIPQAQFYSRYSTSHWHFHKDLGRKHCLVRKAALLSGFSSSLRSNKPDNLKANKGASLFGCC